MSNFTRVELVVKVTYGDGDHHTQHFEMDPDEFAITQDRPLMREYDYLALRTNLAPCYPKSPIKLTIAGRFKRTHSVVGSKGKNGMKKFYIVKKVPEGDYCKGDDNKCYDRTGAFDRAKSLVAKDRGRFVVMEAVAAFGPACDVVEIPLEE